MSANANGMITFNQHMQAMRENTQLVRDVIKTFTDASVERDRLLFAKLHVPNTNLPINDEELGQLQSPREASVQRDQVPNENNDHEAIDEVRQTIESAHDKEPAEIERVNNSPPSRGGAVDLKAQDFNASPHDGAFSAPEQKSRTSQAQPTHSIPPLVSSILQTAGDGLSPLERRRQTELKKAYAREAGYQAKRLREGSPPRLIDRSARRGPPSKR